MIEMQQTSRSLTPLILWHTARYTLVCFLVGFVVWAVMSMVLYPRYGSVLINPVFLGPAFAYASFMAAVVGLVTFFAYRKLFAPGFDKPYSVRWSQYIAVALPYSEAFDRCLATLSPLGTTYVLLANRTEGRIEAAVIPRKLWQLFGGSLGQRITIRLGSDTEGETKALIESKAVPGWDPLATGKHKRNVDRIVQALNGVSVERSRPGAVPAT